MKLPADQYYYAYFCMFEEPAIFKPLSYSSEFVSIRQPLRLSTDNASFQAKNIRAGSPDIFMSMAGPDLLRGGCGICRGPRALLCHAHYPKNTPNFY